MTEQNSTPPAQPGSDAPAARPTPRGPAQPAPGAGPAQRAGARAAGGSRRVKPAVITVLVLAALGGAAWWGMQRGGIGALVKPAEPSASAAAMNLALAKTVVATIDGKTVMEAELASLLATGADRAVAIDRYINKVLAAEAARSRYAEDARALSTAAEREVLANLYLQRRNQEILQSVTEEQVAEYYKANVRDEDYASFRLRYYLTRDQADAVNFRSLLDKADKGAQSRLSPLGNTGDGFLPFQGIPYGLGQVVRRAKPGEVIGPVTVRDGLLVLVLDDVRSGKKPEIGAVKNEIRALLADRQLTEELLGLRKKANIQLN